MKKVSVPLVSVVALVTVVAGILAVPSVRAQVASWLGFGIEQREALPPLIGRVLNRAPWDVPDEQPFEMYTVGVPQARREWVAQALAQGLTAPAPGGWITFPDGTVLPVPEYLPEGYRWQGVAALHGAGPPAHGDRNLLWLGSGSAAGGGTEPLPPYDRGIAQYLIGGDPEDHLLLLARLRGDGGQGLLFQSYHVVSEGTRPADPHVTRAPSGGVRTPTPPASYYEPKVQVGLIVREAADQEGLVFLVGQGELGEITVAGQAGIWYRGTWDASGRWVDGGVINLVWQHGDVTYQLTGQGMELAELVRVAESLPA